MNTSPCLGMRSRLEDRTCGRRCNLVILEDKPSVHGPGDQFGMTSFLRTLWTSGMLPVAVDPVHTGCARVKSKASENIATAGPPSGISISIHRFQ
jgi:hypothetical protein